MTLTDIDMREKTALPGAASIVGEVDTERGTFGSWIVREVARFSSTCTVALKIVPADGDLGRVMSIRACKATTASTCEKEREMSRYDAP